MAENKVRFNLRNVYYAVLTPGATPSWATPVHIPGGVSLDLTAEGDSTDFYADGVVFYHTQANNGYSGSLEMARISDAMMADVWGDTLGGTSKVLTENANTEPKPFALLYQIDGDADEEYYVLYNVNASRPNVGSQTNEATKEPRTQTIDISAIPLSDGRVMARTTNATPSATKTAWFSSVFVES